LQGILTASIRVTVKQPAEPLTSRTIYTGCILYSSHRNFSVQRPKPNYDLYREHNSQLSL